MQLSHSQPSVIIKSRSAVAENSDFCEIDRNKLTDNRFFDVRYLIVVISFPILYLVEMLLYCAVTFSWIHRQHWTIHGLMKPQPLC